MSEKEEKKETTPNYAKIYLVKCLNLERTINLQKKELKKLSVELLQANKDKEELKMIIHNNAILKDQVQNLQEELLSVRNENYNIIKKKDIFVGVVKMIEGITEEGIPIAVKTNVTSIPNLNTIIYNYCYFKKTKNNPLYILCLYKGGSSYTQLK